MNYRMLLVLVSCMIALSACGGGGSRLFDDELSVGSSRVAIPTYLGAVAPVAGRVAFLASEFSQGGQDLNGDADAADNVVQILDPATGIVTNTGLAGRVPLSGGARFAAWAMPELDQGFTDRTGDSDVLDQVLVVFDSTLPVGPANPLVTNIAVAFNSVLIWDGDVVSFITSEIDVGFDLNFDSDVIDFVPRTYNALAATLFTTAFAFDVTNPGFAAKNGLLVFSVSEDADSFDSNNDGDTLDSVLIAFDVQTSMFVVVGNTFPRAAFPLFRIIGTVADPGVVYAINEAEQANTNLNSGFGDTDIGDAIVAIWRRSAGETLPLGGLGIDPESISASAARVCFSADEQTNGLNSDFNGDLDSNDKVPFWSALNAPGIATSVGYAVPGGDGNLFVCDDFMIFLARESDQGAGGTNLNPGFGDTDTSDLVAFFLDLSAPGIVVFNTGYAARQAICFAGEDCIFITAPEADNGSTDLNVDGDSSDIVPVYFRITGSTLVRGEDNIVIDGLLTFQICPEFIRIWGNVSEMNFNADLNRDTDADDFVLCASRIRRSNGKIISFEPVATCDRDGSSFAIRVDADTIVFPSAEDMAGPGHNMNGPSGDSDTADLILAYINGSCL